VKKKILISLSYLLVAMLATVTTLAAIGYPGYASGTKLEQLESLILERFIGDADQLPSVGPGHVLHDLIRCGQFPVTALDTIFRQGEGSAISLNARRINRGEMPAPGQGFELWQAENPGQVWQCLQQLCAEGDWQVITPMKKGESGVISLNGKLQELINPAGHRKAEFAR